MSVYLYLLSKHKRTLNELKRLEVLSKNLKDTLKLEMKGATSSSTRDRTFM